MKPLWASVFMMLAMFLQSSAEKAQRCRVRATIPLGAFGSSSESHAGAVPGAARPPSLGDVGGCAAPGTQPLCPHQSRHSVPSALQWCGVSAASPALATCVPLRPRAALGWIHAQDPEACLGQWHGPGCWRTHPRVLQARTCPTARGEPVDGEGSVPASWTHAGPQLLPAAASVQAQCWSPQPPLPAPLSLGGTGQ